MAELSTDPAATTATTASCCSAETQATLRAFR
jgi:hypothetical protein